MLIHKRKKMSSWKRNNWAKIIFLDIDWVVVAPYEKMKTEYKFHKEKVEILKDILERTWAKIVISSSWKYRLDRLVKQWTEFDIPIFIDTTQHHYWVNRKDRQIEILERIQHNQVKDYVIIDDCNWHEFWFFEKVWRIVKTDAMKWITKKEWEKVINILMNKKNV